MKHYDENWALDEAVKVASYSPCQSKRGVIIWHRNKGLIAAANNRPPAPFECDSSDACKANCGKTAVHAEQRALLYLINTGMRGFDIHDCEMLHVKQLFGKPMFSDKPTCWQCSKLILEAGISHMWLYQRQGLVRYTAEEFHKLTLQNNNLL